MSIWVYDKDGNKHAWAGTAEQAKKRFGWSAENPKANTAGDITPTGSGNFTKPGGYQSPYSTDIGNALASISKMGSFSYNPEDDEGLQAAQDEATSNVSRAAARRGMLYSNSNKSQMGKSALALVPQFEQNAFNKYQSNLNNLFNQLSTLSQLDTQAYNKYRDTISDQQAAEQNAFNNAYNMAQLTGTYIPGFTGQIDPSLSQYKGDFQAEINRRLATPDTSDDAVIPQLQYLRNLKIQSDPNLAKQYGNTLAGIPTLQKQQITTEQLNKEWERSENNPAYKTQLLNAQIAELELKNLPERQKLELQQLRKQIANIGFRQPQSAADILKDEYELELYKQKIQELKNGGDTTEQDTALRQQAMNMAKDPVTGQVDTNLANTYYNYLKYGSSISPEAAGVGSIGDAESNSLPAGIGQYFVK